MHYSSRMNIIIILLFSNELIMIRLNIKADQSLVPLT